MLPLNTLRNPGWLILLSFVGGSMLASCSPRPEFLTGDGDGDGDGDDNTGGTPGDGDGDMGGMPGDGDASGGMPGDGDGDGQACTEGACDDSCDDGLENCSGSCVDLQTSATNCGVCGTACDNGKSCTAGACACSAAEASCGSCLGWDFESGLQGWSFLDGQDDGVTLKGYDAPTFPTFDGSQSAMGVYVETNGGGYIGLKVPICITDLSNLTFVMHLRFESALGNFPGFEYLAGPVGSSGVFLTPGDNDPGTTSTWHTWTGTIPSGSATTELMVYISTYADWDGMMYVDEVYVL